MDAMRTGYPRFFVPRVVDKLAERIIELHRARNNGDRSSDGRVSAIIFPNRRYAEIYLQYLARHASPEEVRDVHGIISAWDGSLSPLDAGHGKEWSSASSQESLNVSAYRREISTVIYPSTLYPLAKGFWQHTGFGISSRRATYWLENSPLCGSPCDKSTNNNRTTSIEADPEPAKEIIRARISDGQSLPNLKVDKQNVLLYPTGMTAITETASAIKKLCTINQSPPTAAVFG